MPERKTRPTDRSWVEEHLFNPGPDWLTDWIAGMDRDRRDQFVHDWSRWSRPGQRAPKGDWHVWLLMAGRGFGKTRAGAEWVRAQARHSPRARIALVAATRGEARRVMIEGESGLLAISPDSERPDWRSSIGQLRWPNGAEAFVYSAADPEALRGPQHSAAWTDELAKWPNAIQTWDNLMMGLRVGRWPRAVATTTPRPAQIVRRLVGDAGVRVTGGRMDDNRVNLASSFMASMRTLYGGTRLGRQELGGELIEDVAGALWTRALIEARRVRAVPDAARMVVAVDPPAGTGGDACGIVAVALGRDGFAYVIEDASVTGMAPDGWAQAVAGCAARHHADRVVAEANNGGAMVENVLRAAVANLPVRLVHASRGKVARAEPVAALYAAGRAFHVGAFPDLEDELCGLVTGGGYEGPGRSPDRADALVWAMSELMLGPQAGHVGVRML